MNKVTKQTSDTQCEIVLLTKIIQIQEKMWALAEGKLEICFFFNFFFYGFVTFSFKKNPNRPITCLVPSIAWCKIPFFNYIVHVRFPFQGKSSRLIFPHRSQWISYEYFFMPSNFQNNLDMPRPPLSAIYKLLLINGLISISRYIFMFANCLH